MLPHALMVATTVILEPVPVLLVPPGPACGPLLVLHATPPRSIAAVLTAANTATLRRADCLFTKRSPLSLLEMVFISDTAGS